MARLAPIPFREWSPEMRSALAALESAEPRHPRPAVDELLVEGSISNPTWSLLSAELDTQQLLDVIFTVSGYDAFARMLHSFEVDLDEDLIASRDTTDT